MNTPSVTEELETPVWEYIFFIARNINNANIISVLNSSAVVVTAPSYLTMRMKFNQKYTAIHVQVIYFYKQNSAILSPQNIRYCTEQIISLNEKIITETPLQQGTGITTFSRLKTAWFSHIKNRPSSLTISLIQ